MACAIAASFEPRLAHGDDASAKVPRVAFVFSSVPLADLNGPEPADPGMRAFVKGLRDLGWIDGRNIVIERHSAQGAPQRLPGIMQSLVRSKVDVIVTPGGALRYAEEATDSIPIVALISDPLESGTVASLARPGRNITGVSTEAGHLDGKRLDLLKSMVPRLSRVAVLTDPFPPDQGAWRDEVERAARALGISIAWIDIDNPQAVESTLAKIVRERADAIYATDTLPNFVHRRPIAQFAVKHRLPSIYPYRDFVEAGGLVSYGSNFGEQCRRAAAYVHRILKGAKPTELPIEQPTAFELVINGTTVKALGLTIPTAVRVRVDEVID